MTVLSDDELKGIQVPVLYLAGENEKMYSVKDAVNRLDSISPSFTSVIIPNTGHCLMFSNPGMVNDKILGFLNQ